MHDSAQLFYKQNGYYIAKGLLFAQSSAMANILTEIDTIIVQQLMRLNPSLTLDVSDDRARLHQHLKQLIELDKNVYIASLKLCANLFSVMNLLMCQEVQQLVASFGISLPVLQSHPVLHLMAADLKIPGGYHGIGVHQDWASLQGSLDTIIIWIPFMAVTSNNFPVEFVPRSHLQGLYPGKILEHLYEIDPNYYAANDFIPSEMAFGDVLCMSSFLLHRTRMTPTGGLRIACTIRYENASEPTYIERAYPHAQKRSVNRELISANFPTEEQVKRIYS